AASDQTLQLPSGNIAVGGLDFPANLVVQGVPGRTELTLLAEGGGLSVQDRAAVVLRDIGFSGGLSISASDDITLERCRFSNAAIGVSISDAGVTLRDCRFTGLGDAAIHAMDSRGLLITGNRIDGCGNAGIRIWRSANGADGADGSIITGNRIARIGWDGGGNGQNGNGINVF